MPIHNPRAGFISSHVKVRKKSMTKNARQWVKDRLEFYHAKSDTVIQVYEEDETFLYLPRGIFLRNDLPVFPELSDQRTVRPASIPDPIIELRPEQKKAINKLRRRGGGVLRAPTASGKTVMFLYLMGILKQKTLVVVHTVDLVNQWVERCDMVLGMRPGIIGNGSWDEQPGIVIATVQTLSRYDMNKSPFADSYGMVLIDECHKAPAASFQKVAAGMSAKWLYGCTATPTRPDGMHPVMHAILGPVVSSIDENEMVEQGKLIRPKVIMVESDFNSKAGLRQAKEKNQWKRQALYRKSTKQLIHDDARNSLIAKIIIKNKDRSVLVLSERIEHLENIYDMLLRMDPTVNAEIITGQTDKGEREYNIERMRQRKLNVMLSTKLAKEGLDIPVLNVLIKAYPTKSKEPIIQEIGRIMRTADGKVRSKVYDIVDHRIPTLQLQGAARRRVYLSRGCDVRGWQPKE